VYVKLRDSDLNVSSLRSASISLSTPMVILITGQNIMNEVDSTYQDLYYTTQFQNPGLVVNKRVYNNPGERNLKNTAGDVVGIIHSSTEETTFLNWFTGGQVWPPALANNSGTYDDTIMNCFLLKTEAVGAGLRLTVPSGSWKVEVLNSRGTALNWLTETRYRAISSVSTIELLGSTQNAALVENNNSVFNVIGTLTVGADGLLDVVADDDPSRSGTGYYGMNLIRLTRV